MPDTTKRLHYFDHQFLRANDFNDEQNYHVNRLRIHNRALHTPGIAEGLKVIFETGATAVTVQKGTAVDGEGQLIILTEDQRVELGDQAADAAVYITIAYKETQSDISKESDVHDNTRWTEEPDIRDATKRPDNPTMQLILGKASRAGTIVSAIDESDRKAAGAASGDISTHGVTLIRDGIDPTKWPKLSCSDVNQAALENGSLRLDEGREIFFRDTGQLRSLDNNHRIVFNRKSNRLELYEIGDISFNTGNPQTEKLKILANGNVGISAGAGADKLEVGGTLRILTGSNPLRFTSGWSDFPAGAVNQAEISNDTSGYKTLMIIGNRSNEAGVRRVSVWDRLEVNGNLLTTANLTVNAAITPSIGNAADKGIQFPANPGGGAGDEAFIRYFATAGETTTLRIGVGNDPDDSISFWQSGAERMIVSGGNVGIGATPAADKLDVAGTLRILTGSNPLRFTSGWSDFPAGAVNQAEISNDTGTFKTLMIIGNRSNEAGVRRVSVWDRLEVNGNLLTTGNAQFNGNLTMTGAITPSVGDAPSKGIQFPANPGGGAGDEAFIRYFATAGETTTLRIGVANDPDDSISFWQSGAERMLIRNGNVGIGVPDPGFALDVSGRSRIRDGSSSAGHWLYQNKADRAFIGLLDDTHVGLWGTPVGWGLHMDTSNANVVMTGKLTVGGQINAGNSDIYFTETNHNHTGFGNAAGNAAIENAVNYNCLMILGRNIAGQGRMIGMWDHVNIAGNLKVGGAKSGYVADEFINNLGETLEQGDVVVISKNQAALFQGKDNNIPVPEVDLAATAYDTRVCGVVCEFTGQVKSAETEKANNAPKGKGTKQSKASAKQEQPDDAPSRAFMSEMVETDDHKQIAHGQSGYMVTLGAFSHCKVDADIAPIEVGDLLTTSPTRGHAQKVTDPARAVGAIIGKALGSLDKGKGKIPILVTL